MFTEALFTIAKIWKQSKCPLIEKWIKIWYTHTHTYISQYHSAIKKNEILPFSTTCMDLEDIILCEKTQRKTNATGSRLYV